MVKEPEKPQEQSQDLLPPKDKPRLADHEIDERAAEAQVLLNNSVLNEALNDVYSRAHGTLLNADMGSLTASTAHGTMKAVQAIRSQLEQYVSDRKMRQRFNK